MIFDDLQIYRTLNGLLFYKDSENTPDACVTMLAADQWKKEGKKLSDFYRYLPSQIQVEHKLTERGREEEQIYQSLFFLGGVEKSRLPERRPLTALAKAIKQHGSLILSLEKNSQRHWIVIDNIVQLSARVTPTNPYPQLGVAARVPKDGTHRIYNGEEFWKNLRRGQYFFYSVRGTMTPLSPAASPTLRFFFEVDPPARKKIDPLTSVAFHNRGMDPLKMRRFTNLVIKSPVERPGSQIETLEPLLHQTEVEPESPGHNAFQYFSGNLVLGAPKADANIALLDLDPDGVESLET